MTGWHAWGIILPIVVIWKSTANAADVSAALIPLNEGDKKPLEPNKYIYSWTGPNALARSALVERQERLQYNCELESKDADIGSSVPESFRNILVDDLHELLYCYVPKVCHFFVVSLLWLIVTACYNNASCVNRALCSRIRFHDY